MLSLLKNQILPKIARYLIILAFLIVAIPVIGAPPVNTGKNQWYLSGELGTAVLVKEFSRTFQALQKEFDHTPGYVINLSLARKIGEKLELGVSISPYHLSGTSNLPDFSAIGNHGAFKGTIYQEPVEYSTSSFNYFFFARYFLIQDETKFGNGIQWFPFVEAGLGENLFKTEVKYQTLPEGATKQTIFSKGTKEQPKPGNAVQWNLGAGTKIKFTESWSLLLELTGDFVMYDCMDAVHNYDTAGKDIATMAFIPKFMMGIVVPIDRNNSRKKEYQPWAP